MMLIYKSHVSKGDEPSDDVNIQVTWKQRGEPSADANIQVTCM